MYVSRLARGVMHAFSAWRWQCSCRPGFLGWGREEMRSEGGLLCGGLVNLVSK